MKLLFNIFLLCLTGLISAVQTMAQSNLVPNGNFEIYISCPFGFPTWWVESWTIPPNHYNGTEYFHVCAVASYSVPNNARGYQPALTDSAYMGIICYNPNSPDSRGYLQVQLTEPLCAGQHYKAGFFVNKADKARYSISNLGMRITEIPDTGDGTANFFPVIPQIKRPDTYIFLDTVNWEEISGIYTATGGEQYITIGNFDSGSNINVIDSMGGVLEGAYYYIDSVFIIPEPEDLISTSSTSLCPGESITITAMPNPNYLWQNAGGDTLGTDNVLVLTPDSSTVVFLTSCHAWDSIYITIQEPPSVALGNDTTLCTGDTLILDATNQNAVYQWQDSSDNAVFNVIQPGTYSVQVSNQCGTASDTVVIAYYSEPQLFLGSDTLICTGNTLVLDAGQWESYLWSTGDTLPTFTPLQSGNYFVTVTDENGCTATDSITVTFDACLGINESQNNYSNAIRIFPNPASEQLNIQSTTHNIQNITLYDLTGKALPSLFEENKEGVTLNTRHLPKGLYFIQIELSDDSIEKAKFTKE